MRLYILECFRIQAKTLIGFKFNLGLGETTGSGNPVGPAVLIDSGPFNDAVDMISVAQGGLKRFEDQDANGLTWHKSVSAFIESLALTIRR